MRKYKQVSETLRGRIVSGKLGVGSVTPTVRALSDEFAVSLLTAHQALKELVAQGLIEAQPGHGYRVLRPRPLREPPRPKALKGALRTYSLYDLEGLRWRGWCPELDAAQNEAGGFGLDFQVRAFPDGADQPKFIRDDVRSDRPTGVLLMSLGGFEPTRQAIRFIRAEGVPLVVLHHGFRSEQFGVSSVATDFLNAGARATEYLLEKGALILAAVGCLNENPSTHRPILRGAQAAFEDTGLPTKDFLSYEKAPDWQAWSGYHAMRELLKQRPDINGVIFAHHLLAQGGLRAIEEGKRRPGRDIHIVAMPNRDGIATQVSEQVCWLDFPSERIGREAVRMLVNANAEPVAVERVRLPVITTAGTMNLNVRSRRNHAPQTV